jgi:hypothetical protein
LGRGGLPAFAQLVGVANQLIDHLVEVLRARLGHESFIGMELV